VSGLDIDINGENTLWPVNDRGLLRRFPRRSLQLFYSCCGVLHLSLAKGVSSSILPSHPLSATVSCEIRPSRCVKGAAIVNVDSPHSSVRILVVDDFEPWRRHVCSVLETRSEFTVIAEIADGLEAVQKADELKPDLILLDIGLPNLDGLEAATRIRRVAPGARIIFLTLNSDKDIVRAALSNGAQGYVLKTDAESELLPAIKVVLRGEKFVSSGIKWDDFSDTGDT
jgi:CheY-like chemotaxis protein